MPNVSNLVKIMIVTQKLTKLKKNTTHHDKLEILNKNVTSNKTKNLLVEKELTKLSKKVEVISTKGLSKDLINGYKILNGAKLFFIRNILKLFIIYTS